MDRFFGEGGFRRLQGEGTVYDQCRYAMASMLTGPGHAVLLTGAYPAATGVTANDMCDWSLERCFYCAADTAGTPSPFPLQTPTVGEVLRAKDTASRVIGIGIKDRAAILMSGVNASAVVWMDPETGEFTTSSAYTEPQWLRSIQQGGLQRYVGKTWAATIPPDLNPALDDAAWEGTYADGSRTFPHTLPDTVTHVTIEDVAMTPFGVTMLMDGAIAVIDAERLGHDDHPDLLTIGVSSTDYAGHRFGPDSREVQEVFTHVDRELERLIDHLDDRVGREHYVLIVTSDHGVAPVPEMLLANTRPREPQLDAGRIPYSLLRETVERVLTDTYGVPGDTTWIWQVHAPSIYLNHEIIDEKGLDLDAVRHLAANAVGQIPGIGISTTHTALLQNGRPAEIDTATWRYLQNAFHPDRSGDVIAFPKRYWILGSKVATHGTPHDYDRWVPLMMRGGGLPARMDCSRAW